MMVTRMCIALFIQLRKGSLWLLEQPKSSLMHLHPRLRYITDNSLAPRVHTSMGAFGAPSMKPSMLMGNVPWINSLRRAPTDDDRMRFASHSVVDVDSQGAVTGRGPELKAT